MPESISSNSSYHPSLYIRPSQESPPPSSPSASYTTVGTSSQSASITPSVHTPRPHTIPSIYPSTSIDTLGLPLQTPQSPPSSFSTLSRDNVTNAQATQVPLAQPSNVSRAISGQPVYPQFTQPFYPMVPSQTYQPQLQHQPIYPQAQLFHPAVQNQPQLQPNQFYQPYPALQTYYYPFPQPVQMPGSYIPIVPVQPIPAQQPSYQAPAYHQPTVAYPTTPCGNQIMPSYRPLLPGSDGNVTLPGGMKVSQSLLSKNRVGYMVPLP